MAYELLATAIGHVATHPGVTIAEQSDCAGATDSDFLRWEREYHPFVLPQELKRLYRVSDGLRVRWHFRVGGACVGGQSTLHLSVGWSLCMHKSSGVTVFIT
jgi:hypothetical protein